MPVSYLGQMVKVMHRVALVTSLSQVSVGESLSQTSIPFRPIGQHE